MHLFCIDESGCTGAIPGGNSVIQPVLVLGGIIIEYSKLEHLTHDLIALKAKYFKGLSPRSGQHLDWIRVEIKGAEIRKLARGNRDDRRFAHVLMGEILDLLEKYHVQLLARVYIKKPGEPFPGAVVYHAALRNMADDFHHFLSQKSDNGLIVMDHRNRPQNTDVAHGIFTQKFKSSGDKYTRIIDIPLFGHSDNHAALQTADFLCSALLFPMAAYTYCMGKITNDHVHYPHGQIRDKFGRRLQTLQHRYNDAGRWRGGIVTSDKIANLKGSNLFGA